VQFPKTKRSKSRHFRGEENQLGQNAKATFNERPHGRIIIFAAGSVAKKTLDTILLCGQRFRKMPKYGSITRHWTIVVAWHSKIYIAAIGLPKTESGRLRSKRGWRSEMLFQISGKYLALWN
jgi:hypothetical protein